MLKHYTSFTYNGINSLDMDITHVSTDSGLYQESLGGNRTIKETQNSTSDRRYFNRIGLDPIDFDLIIMFNEPVTIEQQDFICAWLIQDYYQELYFEDELDKIYYCMVNGRPTINHNGLGEGYITFPMRCFDGYLYSREIIQTFDLTANTSSGTNITLYNDGHVEVYPLVTIALQDTSVTLLNLTTNESTQFTNVLSGETLTLDNENEEISTSIAGMYRYANHNDVFMRILPPSTQFTVTGKCTLTFDYRNKRKF